MKALIILLVAVCYVQCRKTYQPLDKNANLAFINMESGGMKAAAAPTTRPQPVNSPVATPKPASPAAPKPATPVTQKPAAPAVTPPVPKPALSPVQVKPVPVNPKPVAIPISTPGPGSVKQLVNFYDSQGKASPIRPYSYSQAVKQG